MFGLFGSGGGSQAAAPAASAAAPTQGAQPTGGEGGQPGAQAPVQATSQAATVKPEGLDYLNQLFDNNAQGGQAKQAPRLQLTAEQLGEVASKQDFSKGISQEAFSRLQSGDMSALGEILNSVGQQIYQQAMHDATYLTDRYVDSRVGHENSDFDARVARSMSTNNVQGINDLHPMAQNMLKQTIAQLRTSNPQASQSELENQAWELLGSLGSQFDRESRAKQRQAQQAEPNWDDYAGFAEERG